MLEARFIESLKKIGGVGGLPTVRLVQDVVNGKSGYVLEVGGQRYRMEPQADLNGDCGVVVASRPDFVIWPWGGGAKRRPIAVFCDGWAYHKDSIRVDALKRSAIVVSGLFWVWSVTHHDVKAALAGSQDCDMDSPLVALSRHDGSKAPATLPRAQEKAFTQNAVAGLVRWLAIESGRRGRGVGDPTAQCYMVELPHGAVDARGQGGLRSADGSLATPTTPHIREPGTGFAPVMSRPNRATLQVGWWPLLLAKGLPASDPWTAPGVVLLDESHADDEEDLHREWRRWLQLYNACQFLPGMLLTTSAGLDGHDYEVLGAGYPTISTPGQPAMNGAWQEVMDQAQTPMRPGLVALAKAGAAWPEVGMELADDKGRVVADAELTWGEKSLVLLRPDQSDQAEIWRAHTWVVCQLDESLTLIEGGPWHSVIATILGLKIN